MEPEAIHADREPSRAEGASGDHLCVWSPPRGELRDVRLHVRVRGDGPRTFVLLHGLTGSNRYFGAAFDTLGVDGRLVVPDLLGFGGSLDRQGGDYGPDAHAEAVMQSLGELQAKPPFYVGAHSVGTPIALRLAARWPDTIRGVVAFGPPLFRTREQARAQISRLGLWVRLFALETVWARMACAWMCHHREAAARIAQWMRPDLPAAIAREGVLHHWSSYMGSLRNLILETPGVGDLEHVRAPVVFVAGEEDRVVDASLLRSLADTRPNVRVERWPGGHDLPLSSPERCVETLRALKRIEEDRV